MATTLTLDTAINTASSARSVGELRSSLRALIGLQDQVGDSGSESFRRLQEAINETEGRVGDLNDSFNTLRGSGVERVNASIGLFTQGLQNADPTQLSAGLAGLKAAMSAIPIFLVVEGLKLLYENFDKVKEVLFGTTDATKANEEALAALKVQQDANKEALDKYIGSLEKELETLALTDGSLRSQLALRKEITKVQVGALDELIKAKEADIAATEGQIAADKDAIVVAQLQSAQSGAAALQYQTTNDAAQKALQAQLKRQQDELTGLKYLQVDRENTIAKGAQAQQKLIDDANKKALEAWQKREDAINKLIADRVKARNAAAAFEAGGDAEAEAMRVTAIEKSAEQIASVNDDIFLQTVQQGKNEFAILQANLAKSLDGRIQLIEQKKLEELAKLKAGSEAAILIERDANEAIFREKVNAANKYVAVAQQYSNAINSIGQLMTQTENYRLQQEGYAKDAALQNDSNRTAEALMREQANTNELLNNDSLTQSERERIQYDSETRRLSIEQQSKNAQLALTQDFDKKSTEVRKKQFERDKKMKIITGVLNTASAVLTALGTVQPYPVAVAAAIAAGVAGAAQIAVIANQKFDDGGQDAKSTVAPVAAIDTRGGAPSGGGSGGSSNAPFNPNSTQFDPTKVQNAQGNSGTRVYVLESDISNVQNKVNVIESRANFG